MRYREFNWGPGIFIISYHLALFLAVPLYLASSAPSLRLLLISLALLYASGLSISAGYHRFYAHKAYSISKLPESVLLFFSTMALQGSVLFWAFEHRIHHRFTDREQDPHSIKKGFLYAHMLWIFRKPKPIDLAIIGDLMKNRLVVFQHKNYVLLGILANAAAVVFAWWATGDLAGAFVFAFLARLFLLHHFTWFINSLAHTWGSKTYSGEQSAVDNYIIALLTFGEGYHNYHHVFSSDYRNGIRWYHFDPGKWIVWALAKIRMAGSLKKMSDCAIKKTIILKDEKILLEKIKESALERREMLEGKVREMAEKLMLKISEMNNAVQLYRQIREENIKKQVKDLGKSLKESWKEWSRLSREIMDIKAKA
jgi:stearoyl-CoA desaturase (delta-9 desaturase)